MAIYSAGLRSQGIFGNEIWAAKVMEMLLKMIPGNGQVGSGLAQVYLLGGTFGFWRRGMGVTRDAKTGKTP